MVCCKNVVDVAHLFSFTNKTKHIIIKLFPKKKKKKKGEIRPGNKTHSNGIVSKNKKQKKVRSDLPDSNQRPKDVC